MIKVYPKRDALLIVGLQRDLCPGGTLPVPGAEEVLRPINQLLSKWKWFRVATRDWHPPDHSSFEGQGGPWPPHCVQGTPGAEFHPKLDTVSLDLIVSKGMNQEEGTLSGFSATGLARALKRREIRRVFVCGLPTDYAVKSSALDAREAGLEVFVLEDAVRGIDKALLDTARAVKEMKFANCRFVKSQDLK